MKKWILAFCLPFVWATTVTAHESLRNADLLNKGTVDPLRLDASSVTMLGPNPLFDIGSSTTDLRLLASNTNYIRNTSELRSGTTFFVSSGTVQGPLIVVSSFNARGVITSTSGFVVAGSTASRLSLGFGGTNNLSLYFGTDENTGWHRGASNEWSFRGNNSNILQINTLGLDMDRRIRVVNGAINGPGIVFTANTQTGWWLEQGAFLNLSQNARLVSTVHLLGEHGIGGIKPSASLHVSTSLRPNIPILKVSSDTLLFEVLPASITHSASTTNVVGVFVLDGASFTWNGTHFVMLSTQTWAVGDKLGVVSVANNRVYLGKLGNDGGGAAAGGGGGVDYYTGSGFVSVSTLSAPGTVTLSGGGHTTFYVQRSSYRRTAEQTFTAHSSFSALVDFSSQVVVTLGSGDFFIIDGETNPRDVEGPVLEILHKANAEGTRGILLDVEANGFANTHAFHIDYHASGFTTENAEDIIEIIAIASSSVGGTLHGININRVGTGTVKVVGVRFGVNIEPIEHHSGDFVALDGGFAWDGVSDATYVTTISSYNVDKTTGNVLVWENDGDYVVIGSSIVFDTVQILFEVAPTKTLGLTLEFSTGSHLGDDSNGGRLSFPADIDVEANSDEGLIKFESQALLDQGWSTQTIRGVHDEFFIWLKRDRPGNIGSPTERIILTDAGDIEFGWSAKGNVKINSLAIGVDIDSATSKIDVVGGSVTIRGAGSGLFSEFGALLGGTTIQTGDLTMSDSGDGKIRFPNVAGSATRPAICFQDLGGNCDTGIFQGITNQITFSLQGTESYRMSSTGLVMQQGNSFAWDTAGGGGDVFLTIDDANILAQRNGTNAQEFRIYNIDSGSDDEFLSIGTINNTNVFGIEAEATGSGVVREIALLGSNVGIGTADPSSKLDVFGGSITVRGTNAGLAFNGRAIFHSSFTPTQLDGFNMWVGSSTVGTDTKLTIAPIGLTTMFFPQVTLLNSSSYTLVTETWLSSFSVTNVSMAETKDFSWLAFGK